MSSLKQMFPSKPAFTEANLGDLKGKVYVITGANTGVGKELACLLYSKNASVFIAARSEEKSQAAIKDVHESHPRSTGTVEFLAIDLADLESVAQAAKVFQSKAERLDVLFNNAGVMHPPKGSKTKQGYELQLGVHNLGPVLLTELLTPLMARTAAQEAARGAKDGVRVVWVGSLYAELNTPKGGYEPDNIDYSKRDKSTTYKYSASKAGVFYQGTEYARRNKEKGIVSFPINPGNLKTDLQRHHGGLLGSISSAVFLHPAVNGAYTELFAGLSPDGTMEKSGTYIYPWGVFGKSRADFELGARPASEGGTGMGERYYNWCLKQVSPFMK